MKFYVIYLQLEFLRGLIFVTCYEHFTVSEAEDPTLNNVTQETYDQTEEHTGISLFPESLH